MKVLIDTNIVLDAIASREPFRKEAQKIIDLILDNKLTGYITANSITDIYYIARKYLEAENLQKSMRSLFSIFSIIDVLEKDCRDALDYPIKDYEDALVIVCGSKAGMDFIITRDLDFLKLYKTLIPVITPAELIKKIIPIQESPKKT
ncbi:MAG: putative toxin-antitoxin system toxin component, PIN family [Treponema sp.]|nr:putative toxin-antitoxin system toxin component, PIN family [Treponema sp.]